MKQLIEKTKILCLFLLALSFLGCEDDDDANLPRIEAAFAFTLNADTGTVAFLNLSSNADSYVWNFGDGTSSTEINPIKSYDTGNYTVTLTAENAAGASSSFEDEIIVNIPLPIGFPVNFDDVNVNYDVSTFGGTSFEIVDNPDQSGSNTSASKVGAITNSGASFEGIFFDLGTALDLSQQKSVRVNFWSNTPVDVLLKLEQGTGADTETTASHGGTGWEEIYFTFDSSESYTRFTLFVDGPGTTPGTFYIDDISQIATEDIPCTDTQLEIPIDFDCEGIDYTTKIVGNVSFMVVDNPQQSGINSEATKVGQITNVGANWENAFFNLDTPIDFATEQGVRMKLYSDQALPILLKFEDGTEAPVENPQNHGGTGWEELTFVFSSSASYNDMVIFVDGPGTAAGTFYVDDIEQVSATPPPTCTPESSENIDPAAGDINWTFLTNDATTTFDAFGNTAGSIVANPVIDAVNGSCNVQQFIKTNGCQTFAGLGTELATALDFSVISNKIFKMKVLAETQLTDVTLRLERLPFPDTEPSQDRVASITQLGAWQELTFDFSDVTTGTFKSMIIYFERNATCDGDVYYFDDIQQVAGGSGSGSGLITNGDFETGDTTGWLFFDNGGSAIVTNEDQNGGSFSAKITSGPTNNPGIKVERFAAGQVSAGQTIEVTFDSRAEALVDGAVINAFLFSETTNGDPATLHNLGAVSTANTWSTNTLSTTIGPDVSGGISLLIEVVCGGAASCNGVVYIDNVTVNVQ
ncbi:carbohydrate binding domain-containing protein [Sungkyunkwania multivorans]|uniref:Carbohydrate binding domain-containing protein n=1 Tax=Sungkyunkwania multivorans TaxID=1173618 RepID=A0ABW3CYW3_9FLAO